MDVMLDDIDVILKTQQMQNYRRFAILKESE